MFQQIFFHFNTSFHDMIFYRECIEKFHKIIQTSKNSNDFRVFYHSKRHVDRHDYTFELRNKIFFDQKNIVWFDVVFLKNNLKLYFSIDRFIDFFQNFSMNLFFCEFFFAKIFVFDQSSWIFFDIFEFLHDWLFFWFQQTKNIRSFYRIFCK